jgi:hypothetical protein
VSFARPRISARRSRPVAGRGRTVNSPSRCLAISAGLGGLLPQALIETLELGPPPRRVHPGWHGRHRLPAGELQPKRLEGGLDPLKLAPDGGVLTSCGPVPSAGVRQRGGVHGASGAESDGRRTTPYGGGVGGRDRPLDHVSDVGLQIGQESHRPGSARRVKPIGGARTPPGRGRTGGGSCRRGAVRFRGHHGWESSRPGHRGGSTARGYQSGDAGRSRADSPPAGTPARWR